MIRFGIVLLVVLIAIGLLVTGAVAGSLLLVMVSIGVAALAALMLLLVVLIWRREIFGVAPAVSQSAAKQQAGAVPAMPAAGASARAGAGADRARAASGRAGGASGRVGGARDRAEQRVPAAARAGANGDEADVLLKPGAAATVGAAGAAGAGKAGATKVRVPASHAAPPAERSARRGRPTTATGRGGDQADVVTPEGGRAAGRRRSGTPERRGAAPPAETAAPAAQAAAAAEPVPPKADRAEGQNVRRDRPEQPERPERLELADRPEPDRAHEDRALEDRALEDKARAARAGADPLLNARVAARRTDPDRMKSDPRFGGRGGPVVEPGRERPDPAGGRSSRDLAATPSVVKKPADAAAATSTGTAAAPKADPAEAAAPRAGAPKAEPVEAGPPRAGEPRADPSRAAGRPAEVQSTPSAPPAKPPPSAEVPGSAEAVTKAAPATPPVTPPVTPAGRKPTDTTVPKDGPADSGKPTATDGDSVPAPALAAATPAKDRDPEPTAGADAGTISVRVVPGITRYHAQECILIRFLAPEDLEVMTLDAAARDGYVPCKACKPDQAAPGRD